MLWLLPRLLPRAHCSTSRTQSSLVPPPPRQDAPHALVLYHWPCNDGVFGALAAHLYHVRTGQAVSFIPHQVTVHLRPEELPVTEHTHTVYLIDYVGQEGFVEGVSRAHPGVRVVVLDHHKTAVDVLRGRSFAGPVDIHVTMDMSGATIAWAYFARKLEEERGLPRGAGGLALAGNSSLLYERLWRMFLLIEDSDLWRFHLPGTKAFVSGLADLRLNFHANSNQGIFAQLCALDPGHLMAVGALSMKERDHRVQEIVDGARLVNLGGRGNPQHGTCLGVLLQPGESDLRSSVGNLLAARSKELGLRPIGAVAYLDPSLSPGLIKVSLRSVGDKDDTTVISQAFGGGGHRKASSMCIPRADFESSWWTGPSS